MLTSGGELTDAGRAAETILLSNDLLMRESVLSGQISEAFPAILSQDQISGEELLPEYLVESNTEESSMASLTDSIWSGFFTYAAKVAAQINSSFLKSWVEYEVSLRNAIAEKRAEALGLDATQYLVAPELGSLDLPDEVTRWSEAESRNPLEGQKSLDTSRWQWLEQNGMYFSFNDDELAAYAAKLVITNRWSKLNQETDKQRQD